MLGYRFLEMLRSNIAGLLFAGVIVLFSFLISSNEVIYRLTHLSPTAFAILFGIVFSPIFFKYQKILECGIHFGAKKLLRLGIILYGFNITFTELASVGFWGFLIASIIIVCVFLIACFAGVRIFGLDRETSMLIGAGSAICGAAAVLALESSLKSDSSKGIIAIGTVVIFGLLGMFFYPLMYGWGMIPFLDGNGMGVYMGATLHEVANVAGAAEMAKDMSLGEFSQSSANIAVIIKMMRVVMLVPFLFIVSYFIVARGDMKNKNDTNKTIQIPWFALMFLGVIIANTFLVNIAHIEIFEGFFIGTIIDWGRFLCTLCIVFAMATLGLQIDFKKFIQTSGKAFGLASLLCIVLVVGGYFLTLTFKGILW